MKILFLNPIIDAEHKISMALIQKRVAVLFPMNAEEAWQMLRFHGTSIDLGIIHRERDLSSDSDDGLKLISKIKADPVQCDLPIILTTSKWSDDDCARHQESSEGVNAYLRYPFSEDQLFEVIEGVLEQSLGIGFTARSKSIDQSGSHSNPTLEKNGSHSNPTLEKSGSLPNPVLEDGSSIFLRPEITGKTDQELSIILEAPNWTQSQVLEPPLVKSIEPSGNRDRPSIEIPITLADSEGQSQQVSQVVEPPSQSISEGSPASSIDISVVQLPGEVEQEGQDLKPCLDQNSSLPASESQSQPGSEPFVSLPPPEQGLEAHPQSENFSESQINDKELAQDMPYLFGDRERNNRPSLVQGMDPAMVFAEPMGDAIVPGGVAKSPDMETIKQYLFLREQDVAILSRQLKVYQDQVALLEKQIKDEQAKIIDLNHTVNEQRQKIENFETVKNNLLSTHQSEVSELKFQIKSKLDKSKALELQVEEMSEQMETFKERVRIDIRKIRMREKELENRIEIMKKDSESLISSREDKIIELKRKLDLLEFNMDLLQDHYVKEKETSARLKERLARVAQVVHVAEGLLDGPKNEIELQNKKNSKSDNNEENNN